MTFRVIKRCLDQEGLVVEELGHINILRVINYHQWTLSKGTNKCIFTCVRVRVGARV